MTNPTDNREHERILNGVLSAPIAEALCSSRG